MLKQPEMILIDVDGTLVDSVPDLTFCTDTMMERLGLPLRGETKVRQWVGNGVERLIKRALVDNMEGEPEEDLYQKAETIFLALYADNTSKRSHLYPGVNEGLAWLKSQGYRVGCVTNKAAQFTYPLLTELGIIDYFEIVISGDTLPEKKPHPAPLLHAASHFGIAPEKALMIGDSISDVKAARAANFQIVCLSYGYNHGVDIRDSQPDSVIDSLIEIKNLLSQAA
ncbi:phosphoglycolate phosphatase [Nitrosococcus oceani]|uniref:Phosphoglycolate phosphatase n=2 Tax=Nitrosococcus oceani TaxID=1229 RepID=GPH_NITOC|nr:phosphoglycolate phosphatase [Nitrosococcus oceani]Q3J8A0.1 RecName: Full=Phosphoglycolate phosphatase; Short=PGP; Short=PGPase [Nitrosococcus oceani ATCC 19707]KFI18745.1 phosphoglycolate phosphatase [Nitrosococcus oceani C-27]ABA58946.1 phosphoglycolate phosphatase [Nitrosococcus oceani ATCC 19707]EDZ67963.1 phosphoglycolate phosphatase, bacterial [Nitrosococcus oceani AFC27]KFI21863.1 phosphoglycolate phosphatase [Nitrosococcus oceani]GEM18958.1 phosphoglycolate phosphatase [Nitrosococc